MRVLLLRPIPSSERFGLGPFFRIEPLGMEYIAAALEAQGHAVTLADLRFTRTIEQQLRASRPRLVGIAAMHALETDAVLQVAARVRQAAPEAFILVGGHSAAAYPKPFLTSDVDAICVDDGELVMPRVAEAIERGWKMTDVPGLLLVDRTQATGSRRTAGETGIFELDSVPLPARHHVAPWQSKYACLAHRPTWLVETARGCPFRCSFCSVWPLYDRSVRERSIDSVCRDFASVGDHVFVADDLFWHHPPRSRALAQELRRRGIRKQWVLVQSRVDLVARHPELLEAWKPFAREFDIFFGLEAATNEGLAALVKDTTVDRTSQAIAIAREIGFGVTGNFVIDPAWGESDFERLWTFIEQQQLWNAGFTILTPVPGTDYYEQMKSTIGQRDWSHFDMHHLLWEPKLGAERFFELYCQTWRRSILNLSGRKRWWQWLADARIRDALFLTRMLLRTQNMMDPKHYLREHTYTISRMRRQSAA